MRSRRLETFWDPLLDAPELTLVLGLKATRRLRALTLKAARPLQKFRPLPASCRPSANLLPRPAEVEKTQHPSLHQRFVLYRIVGNDLYPRHDAGQSLANLRFILEHESALEGCEKRWLLNRIRQPEKLLALTSLLESHGYGYDVIPYHAQELRDAPWDWSVLPSPGYLASPDYRRQLSHQRQGWELALYRHKNNYLMNNNGARNWAIQLGRARGDWILPWDGNCFLTEAAWRQLREVVLLHGSVHYFHVPMQRIGDNSQLLDPEFKPDPIDEPQLIFSAVAADQFNGEFPYGRRPKVELLWRLGLPGPWDAWSDEPWDQPRRPRLNPLPACPRAGWVARLHSGVRDGEPASSAAVLSQQRRYSARNLAIKASINQAMVPGDQSLLASAFAGHWELPLQNPQELRRLEEESSRSKQLLERWIQWWEGGEGPPWASAELLVSAFNHVLWRVRLSPPAAEEEGLLLERLGTLWFDQGSARLQPRLRLLKRPLAPGRMAGTAPAMTTVLQLALLSDLLAWRPEGAESEPLDRWGWTAAFWEWRDTLAGHLQGLIRPAWLGNRDQDDQRLQLVLALLQRHRGHPTEPVDALLRLLSFHHPLAPTRSVSVDSQLRDLCLSLADQHGLVDCNLAAQLGHPKPIPPRPPLVPLGLLPIT